MMFDDTLISIHAPTRGATILCNHRGLVFGFQSTLPREERLSFPCNISFHLIFQSTLPREERRGSGYVEGQRYLISIHAPTRGATSSTCYSTTDHINFNPRSHERSDQSACPCSRHSRNFNPRSHERSDRLLVKSIIRLRISIHAPTRGATSLVKVFPYLFLFQSTLPREERL